MKQQITLRVDQDVIAWFKSTGKGFHGRMNGVLREHMLYTNYSDTVVPEVTVYVSEDGEPEVQIQISDTGQIIPGVCFKGCIGGGA